MQTSSTELSMNASMRVVSTAELVYTFFCGTQAIDAREPIQAASRCLHATHNTHALRYACKHTHIHTHMHKVQYVQYHKSPVRCILASGRQHASSQVAEYDKRCTCKDRDVRDSVCMSAHSYLNIIHTSKLSALYLRYLLLKSS